MAMFTAVTGLFVPWTIHTMEYMFIEYVDNIFCIIKAEWVQSNLLFDSKYYVFKQCKIW